MPLNPRRVAEWEAFQAKYRAAWELYDRWDTEMRVRHGADYRHYVRGARDKANKLRQALGRVTDRMVAWLDKNSAWEWRSGVALHWTATKATAAMVLSDTAPTLPAEAAAYGYPQRDFTIGVRGPQTVELED